MLYRVPCTTRLLLMHSFIKRQSSGTFEWPVPGSTRQSIHQKKIPHPFFLVSSAVALCEQRFSMLFMFYAFAFAAFHILFATVKGQIQNLIVRIAEKKCLCLHALSNKNSSHSRSTLGYKEAFSLHKPFPFL